MKKLFALILMLLMGLTAFAQTTFEPVSAKKAGFFSLEQEFLTFPQELRPGQKFLFTSLLHTTQQTFDTKMVYNIYQGGNLIYTISFKTNPEYLPNAPLEKGTRFQSSIYLYFDLTKLKPGPVGIEAYIWGAKSYYSASIPISPTKYGVVSDIDVKTFTLKSMLDCSHLIGTCSTQGTLGIISAATPNADNSGCIRTQVQECPSGQSCFTDSSTGKGACKTSCVPKQDSSGKLVITYSGGDCFNAGVDSCGNQVSVNSNGLPCGNKGTCQNGACTGTCSATSQFTSKDCKSYNSCGDYVKNLADGLPCGQSGYACEGGSCVFQEDPTPDPDPDPDPTTKDCNGDGEVKSTCCSSGNEYSLAGVTTCGVKPAGACENDNECAPDMVCGANNQCKTREQTGKCTVDEYQTCADGSTVLINSCYQGNLVPTNLKCGEPDCGDCGDIDPILTCETDPTHPKCQGKTCAEYGQETASDGSCKPRNESRLGIQLLAIVGLLVLATFLGVRYFGKKRK